MENQKKRRNIRIKLLIATIVLLVAAGIVVYVLASANDDSGPPAAILIKTALEHVSESDGMVESAVKSEVYAPSGLRVLEVMVSEGDTVQTGDLLALLDTETLELEIRRAELNILSAEANLSNEQRANASSVTSARGAVSSALVSLQAAQREYDTLKNQRGQENSVMAALVNLDMADRARNNGELLYSVGDISLETMNQLEDTLKKAQTAYDEAVLTAQTTFERAEEDLEAARIRYENANDTLSDTLSKNTDPSAVALELQKVALEEMKIRIRDARVTAPSGGRITFINAKEGAAAAGLMFVIEDDENLIVKAQVLETDILSITPGMRCRIQPNGTDSFFEGYVTRFSVSAQRDTAGSFEAVNGDDVYFDVEVAIDEHESKDMLIGMNAKVSVIIDYREDCFAVQRTLVYEEDGQSFVVTRDSSGKPAKIPVQIGINGGRLIEIEGDGLYEGMELYKQ